MCYYRENESQKLYLLLWHYLEEIPAKDNAVFWYKLIEILIYIIA